MIINRKLLRRQEERVPIEGSAELREPFGRTAEARILDISAGRCKIETRERPMETNATMLVRLPGLEGLAATIRWFKDGKLGMRFERRLHPAVVDHLAAKHQH